MSRAPLAIGAPYQLDVRSHRTQAVGLLGGYPPSMAVVDIAVVAAVSVGLT